MAIQYSLPDELKASVESAIHEWQSQGKISKLWSKDASLWTGDDEAKWLGWLDIVERQQQHLDAYRALAKDIKDTGFTHALLLGMGGSSLCPEVFAVTFGPQKGYPALDILDSTDPAQVKAKQDKLDFEKTIFIVSSKSGSTLEPNILKQYFFDQTEKAVGKEKAGSHFIAVTDPGSKMEQVAKGDGFRHIFYGDPQIGGRYSALSAFGVVPAAVAGLDVEELLDHAANAASATKSKDIATNPGALLGLILGTAHNSGHDKLTFFTSPEIHDVGAWLEQLIAESTGKVGKGITPVDRELIAPPSHYGNDRIFAYVRLEGGDNAALDAQVEDLAKAGHPVVTVPVAEKTAITSAFFTWEIATAVAGSVMGINTFNQPDVEASKVVTRELTSEYEKTGKLAEHEPIFTGEGVKLFADAKYAATLKSALGEESLTGYLKAHLGQIKAGDYFASLAYVQMTEEHEAAIQEFRHKVRDAKKVATCLGFGPRFLHSTGQDYKGGPNTGVFLQITAEHPRDLPIPDQKYTFGIVIAAQAAGDLSVLVERGRRALRVHLTGEVEAGLKALGAAVTAALG